MNESDGELCSETEVTEELLDVQGVSSRDGDDEREDCEL